MKKINRILHNGKKRILLFTLMGFAINSSYAAGNAVLGIITHSLWLLTLSAYYAILAAMRLSAVLYSVRDKNEVSNDTGSDSFVKTFSGYMLLMLDIILIASVFLTVKQGIGTEYHEIIMISIATYTFTKITLAVINLCKSRKNPLSHITTLRNISFADAAVSVFSMQRSMLVSFNGMSEANIALLNSLTGAAVCVIIPILGLNLIKNGEMMKNSNRKSAVINKKRRK